MKVKFKSPVEALEWAASQNENHCCYEAAEKLYRQAGMIASADRCLRMRMKHGTNPSVQLPVDPSLPGGG